MNISRAIIVGAGRGARLGRETASHPKALTEVAGRTILDWGLAALRDAGIRDVIFICGYRAEAIRRRYPHIALVRNGNWARTNILRSLMTAEACMDRPFILMYSDIICDSALVERMMRVSGPIGLAVEKRWRDRYPARKGHPPSEAPKALVGENAARQLGKRLPMHVANGEFIGMATFRRPGIELLKQGYREAPA